ncbi:hypothetical protein DV515_00007533 [Chloebia gouldiae]|uniref:Uncharacterized protein n=1 Tax=Chloebia gouldiae TaxID=44316 RepID=A0A3L8SI32_CHLGU|nr:hypothetical protein DV515_00007533 [Chloebia gouldiae]
MGSKRCLQPRLGARAGFHHRALRGKVCRARLSRQPGAVPPSPRDRRSREVAAPANSPPCRRVKLASESLPCSHLTEVSRLWAENCGQGTAKNKATQIMCQEPSFLLLRVGKTGKPYIPYVLRDDLRH